MHRTAAPTALRSGRTSGFTLIELMLGIVVLAILLALAVPSFTSQFQKQRLKGAAERLVSELQFARSEAVGANQDILVNVQGGADWCIGVSSEAACDCNAVPGSCLIEGNQRVVTGTEFKDVSMGAVNTTVTFDSVRGLPDGAAPDFLFDGENGKRIQVAVNQLGRTSMCSPAGEQKVGEYPDC